MISSLNGKEQHLEINWQPTKDRKRHLDVRGKMVESDPCLVVAVMMDDLVRLSSR